MESTEVIIARLVLGYLKEERCSSSYKEFLKTSNHLQNHRLLNTKYIPTRFLGLTLEDILTEYFEISQIVQGRLESTSYYNEHHPKNSLLQQVLYLMNRVQHSTISTPCPSSCRSPEDMQIETSPSQREQLSDVETTPAHTLPGNVQYESEESVCHNTPKRKGHKYANIVDTDSPQAEQEQTDVIDTEDLAKSLLENREFQEKIARTINKVAEKKHRVSEELDKTIKTVVKETEQDPIFDQILDDIIGSSGLMDSNKGLENDSSTSCIEDNVEHKQKKIQSKVVYYSEQNVSTGMYPVNQENPEPTHSTYENSIKQQNVIGKDNNEVIVFNGPLENYLGSTNMANTNYTQPQPMQNPVYINPPVGSLLPSTSTCSGLIVPSVASTSQIVLLNQQAQAPWQAPTPYLSEQDIMAMPTVIVNDTSNAVYLISGVPKQQPILPMPTIEVPNLHEFLHFRPRAVNNQPKKGLKKVIYPVSTPKPNASASTSAVKQNGSSENKLPDLFEEASSEHKLPDFSEQASSENKFPDLSEQASSENKFPDSSEQAIKESKPEPMLETPVPVETIRKKTPKSGSHIRNLDFSTPPKFTSSHEKKSIKSPRKASQPRKKQAAKSLFQKEKTQAKERKDSDKIWDHDLRVSIPYTSPPRVRKNKKKGRKSKHNTTDQDAALLEAALKTPVKKESEAQEVALKTPVKMEIETKEEPPTQEVTESQVVIKTQEEPEEAAAEDASKEPISNSANEPEKKTIWSPSKLNNSKRNIMNVKDGDADQGTSMLGTPIQAIEANNSPIKANRNITPTLGTPWRGKPPPKTPGAHTPCDDHDLGLTGFTPFSKMLEANLKGIDIQQLPTPSMPITPTFPPFTPNVELASPYSNRPTDYSTGGSSYYVPSDNEQNKSLEAHLKKIEKKQTVKAQKKENHRDIFNKNVIGKKNLSLMKRNISSPSSCSDSSSDKDDSWVDKASNDTVIFTKKETPRKGYSLRTRKIPEAAASEHKTEKEKKKPTEGKKEKIAKGRRTSFDKRAKKKEAPPREVTPNNDQNTSVSDEERIQGILESVRDNINMENVEKKEKGARKTKIKPEKVDVKASETRVSKERRQSMAAPVEEENQGAENRTKPLTVTDKRAPVPKESPSESKVTKERRQSMAAPVEEENQCTENRTKPLTVTDKRAPVPKESPSESKVTKERRQSSVAAPVEEENQCTEDKMKPPTVTDKRDAVLKELEAKRQRMIDAIEEVAKPTKKSKFKIKPVPNLTSKRKKPSPKKPVKPRKPAPKPPKVHASVLHSDLYDSEDSDITLRLSPRPAEEKPAEKPEHSASDTEAQNLIEGMKERGILLVHNKSPKKKGELNSSSSIDTLQRETYDKKVFDSEDLHVVYDKTIERPPEEDQDRFKDPSSTFIGKVYLEEIGGEIDVHLKFTECSFLLDLPAAHEEGDKVVTGGNIIIHEMVVIQPKQEGKVRGGEDGDAPGDYFGGSVVENALMDYAATGNDDPEMSSPRSARKRRLSGDSEDNTDKATKILKRLDVDQFLNNIHAENNFHEKK